MLYGTGVLLTETNMENIFLPIATYAAGVFTGFLIGWFTHKHVSKTEVQNWERAIITIIVTMAWAASVVFDVAVSGYDTPFEVHIVMGMVAGYFFEGSIKDFIKKK